MRFPQPDSSALCELTSLRSKKNSCKSCSNVHPQRLRQLKKNPNAGRQTLAHLILVRSASRGTQSGSLPQEWGQFPWSTDHDWGLTRNHGILSTSSLTGAGRLAKFSLRTSVRSGSMSFAVGVMPTSLSLLFRTSGLHPERPLLGPGFLTSLEALANPGGGVTDCSCRSSSSLPSCHLAAWHSLGVVHNVQVKLA